MSGAFDSSSDLQARAARITAIVADIGRRRLQGETIADETILDAHPELLPELKQRLSFLKMVEQARATADDSDAVNQDTIAEDNPSELFGETFRPAGYELARVIHAGGQGIVYEARQLTTGRTVAIKTSRAGSLASPVEEARLEREVRLLASLRHPNIVTVHDSGRTGEQSFFVMDYVPGKPLDQALAATKPNLRTRVELFETISSAVNAAHLRGILHRDLKPGNVLIDDNGQPRILDFGLGKDLDQSAAMTETGQFVGSIPWSSPEQARGPADAVDIRSDVYALGVMLFQSLTGQFPYDVSSGLQNALRNIAETPPHKLRELNRGIDEDLETVVLTCLQKDPERRYQSAGELATELRRYLDGEPIAARRDSTLYLLRKQIAKHRRQLSVAGAFGLLLLIGTIITWNLYGQAETLRVRAEESASREERAARRAEAANSFFKNMFLRLDPAQRRGRDASLSQVLERATRDLESEAFADNPALRVEMLTTIGGAYFALGRYKLAIRHLQNALDLASALEDYPTDELTDLVAKLANVLLEQGDVQTAETLTRTALELDLTHYGPNHPRTALSQHNLSAVLGASGRGPEAIELAKTALATIRASAIEDRTEQARVASGLAVLLIEQGDLETAETLLREALEIRTKALPARHPDLARVQLNLAFLLQQRGAPEEAATFSTAALTTHRDVLPSGHPELARTLVVHGLVLLESGRAEEAEPLIREGRDIRGRGLPASHWLLAATDSVLGACLMAREEFSDAEPLLLSAFERMEPDTRAPRSRLRETADRLIQLYSLWNRPADVLRWKAKRDELDEG